MSEVAPLEWTAPQQVTYAVPMWLRDEQIKQAIQRPGVGRIALRYEPRPEPIAVVGFGPSLTETWEQVKQFAFVMSCSGSHKFLVERGVIPTYHVEVDPRPHKVALIGPPQTTTQYLIASTCHGAVFDHLDGCDVKLWHVFDATREGIRTLPHGEYAVMGGCDVGLRAMTLAAFLGFRDVHVFGLDGCTREGNRHADSHPLGKQKFQPVEYGGQTYWTTPAMLEAAKQTVHELQQMPTVSVRFYGEGLTQAMVRDQWKPDEVRTTKPLTNLIAFVKDELISAEYVRLNAQLHHENVAYGVGGEKHAEIIQKLVRQLKTKDVLDYGCGKGRLGRALDFHIQEYDPAVAGKQESPKPADIVACTDVLEHVEPEKLAFVLQDLQRCVLQVGYFTIYCGPAQKTLADGRNAHLIQRQPKWWLKVLRKFFTVKDKWVKQEPPLLKVFVAPKRSVEAVA